MGTTIRRKPIINSIPASPDYKFLNITNFGGLDISTNPFTVSSNTASDCLNVYVDEDNALTTRPRLNFKFNVANDVSGFNQIAVYELHNGYLVHGLVNDNPEMWVVLNDGIKKPVIGLAAPKDKCLVFEQDNAIYLLSKGYYKLTPNTIKGTEQITSYSLSLVEGYVPTVTVGKMKKSTSTTSEGVTTTSYDKNGTSFESLNILSNKYKESYFWDGSWNPESIKIYDADVVENDYYTEKRLSLDNEYNAQNRLFRYMAANVCGYLGELSKASEYHWMVLYNFDGITDDDTFYALAAMNKETGEFDTSKTVKIKAPNSEPMKVLTTDDGLNVCIQIDDSSVYMYGRSSLDDEFVETIRNSQERTIHDIYGATTAPVFMLIESYDNNKFCNVFTKQSDNHFTDSIPSASMVYGYPSYAVSYNITHDGKYILKYYSNLNSDDYGFEKIEIGKSTSDIMHPFWENLNANMSKVDVKVYTSPVDYSIVVVGNMSTTIDDYKAAWYYKDFTTDKVSTEIRLTELPTYSGGVVFSRGENSDKVYVGKYYFTTSNPKDSLVYSAIEFPQDAYITSTEFMYYDFQAIIVGSFAYDSTEPLLFVTRNINTLPIEEYEKLIYRREKFNKSLLCARFDNNIWFAVDNETFYTTYNNPTYVPVTSYKALGETHEQITGLNIINDSVLMAYKKNRLFIITPVTAFDQYTYSYTETKNVIGNMAFNAPILTVLTEMPTLVSYDGIYALNQLENVQSSDRITTLISEPINPKWLKETDIDSCLTLNRLYWTYYILPHKKIANEKEDYTKIYLLDNRNQSWFYWELPIYVHAAMVKNNSVHFVTDVGDVYSLETSDLIHKYNADVTEYYDSVGGKKRLISWYWYSQILSLNTINYSKRLIDTTFILTDTDTQDEYALDFSFKAWRKSVSETNATTISSNIHYVQSTTKRTMIPRFNFIQIRFNNTQDDFDNNKLRLVGLGLKYVLLEGLY